MVMKIFGVLGLFLVLEMSGNSSAFAKTVEAGDATVGWSGKGQVHDLGAGRSVVNATLKGTMFVRHSKGVVRGPIHATKLECNVRIDTDTKKNQRDSIGICTMIAHEGKDVAFGQWKCSGSVEECEGEFTFTGGGGGLSGISGTTPFRSRIDIERPETGEAYGYSHWPNLTYTIP